METETQAPGHRARGWLLAALGVALVALVAYQMWPERSAAPAAETSNRRTAAARTSAAPAGDRPGRVEGQARGAAGEAGGFWRGRAQSVSLSAAAGSTTAAEVAAGGDAGRTGRAASPAAAAADSARAPEVHGDGREAGVDAGGADRLQGIFVSRRVKGSSSTDGTGWSRSRSSRSSSNIPTGPAEPPSERVGTVPSKRVEADRLEPSS